MGTFNGARYLQDQLDSIAAQDYTNWRLLISDDGSSDQTCEIVDRFIALNPTLNIERISGPKQGFCKNYLTALCHYKDNDLVAFCDQDDVWLSNKLDRAVSFFVNATDDIARVYGGVVQMVDANLNETRQTQPPRRSVDFANLLVENCIVGNTLILNKPAADALRSMPIDHNIAYHDWWALQVVTGIGGSVHVDNVPTILYRQHGKNIVGAARGIARKRRNFAAIFGSYQKRLSDNAAALGHIAQFLTPENQRALILLKHATAHGWKLTPIIKMVTGGLRRQRISDTMIMCLSLLKVNNRKP